MKQGRVSNVSTTATLQAYIAAGSSAAGAVVTGSHCDAIPRAGMYDGTLGVVGAVAAIKALQKAGFKPQKSIEALFFTSEEPTRFGLGCIGRSALLLLLLSIVPA